MSEIKQWGVSFMNERQQTMETMVDARTCVEAIEAAARRFNFSRFNVVAVSATALPPDTLDADMAAHRAARDNPST